MCAITANLHIDDPSKVELPRYMHVCKAYIEYLFCFHCSKVKSVDIAVSIISLWHNTFPVQQYNNELIKINLSILQWYSEETSYRDNKVETSVEPVTACYGRAPAPPSPPIPLPTFPLSPSYTTELLG